MPFQCTEMIQTNSLLPDRMKILSDNKIFISYMFLTDYYKLCMCTKYGKNYI